MPYRKELHGHQLEALLLKALDDLADQAPLHTIGLDCNESTFLCHDAENKTSAIQLLIQNTDEAKTCSKKASLQCDREVHTCIRAFAITSEQDTL